MDNKVTGRTILMMVVACLPTFVFAQLQETFADGNFRQDPRWVGDTSAFFINPAGQLQSAGPAVTGSLIQLATPVQAAVGVTWEFYANLRLATSSGNYADVFLVSDSANLQGANAGYFVRLGGTPDEVSLFRKDRAGPATYVINGRDGTLGSSTSNVVRVRVTRSAVGEWRLWIDLTGTGQDYVLEGTAVDATYRRSAYFGILLRYSQANSRNFLFDDFRITDTEPPALFALRPIGPQTLEVEFTEPVSLPAALDPSRYAADGHLGSPQAVQPVADDPARVQLSFAAPFPAGDRTLTVSGIADLYGNRPAGPLTGTFTYSPPVGFNQLLLTEIMASETPPVGLPAAEYLELHNPTTHAQPLQGLRLSDGTHTAILPEAVIGPGAYLILTARERAGLFSSFGQVLGLTNFPSLNNAGDLLTLRRADGKLVTAVAYSDAWYKNPGKSRGGWSLEMVDPTNPCAGLSNWSASEDPVGGTPGRANSVKASNPDRTPPQLVQVAAQDARTLLLRFNERLDSAASINPAAFSLTEGVGVAAVRVLGPLFQEVELVLNQELRHGLSYTLTVQGLRDCAGNPMPSSGPWPFALPQAARRGDVVINEVLFNPRAGGVDFVELVNRSDRHLDLRGWQLANARTDTASDFRTITGAPYVLAPGQYVVLTTRPDLVQAHYPQAKPETFLPMPVLPTYSNAAGTVVLLNPAGLIMDRFAYEENMHFRLLDNVKGVSLERIRLSGDSSAANWQSAASTAGYATPGYRNSQARPDPELHRAWTIDPPVFTPDGDGQADFTTFNYVFDQGGLVANITILDARGREVRRLVNNELLGTSGFFRWDGTTAHGTKVPVGYYIVSIEVFGLEGRTQSFKEKVVVGARFP